MPPGPSIGALLDRLLEIVVADPMLNDRSRLLTLARELVAPGIAPHGPEDAGGAGGTATSHGGECDLRAAGLA